MHFHHIPPTPLVQLRQKAFNTCLGPPPPDARGRLSPKIGDLRRSRGAPAGDPRGCVPPRKDGMRTSAALTDRSGSLQASTKAGRPEGRGQVLEHKSKQADAGRALGDYQPGSNKVSLIQQGILRAQDSTRSCETACKRCLCSTKAHDREQISPDHIVT